MIPKEGEEEEATKDAQSVFCINVAKGIFLSGNLPLLQVA
jgi:hypothetical protein